MVRTAVARRRIAMPGMNHLDLHFLSARDGRVEIVNFKPQEYAVSVRLEILIADWAVMVPHIPSVQLKDQSPVRDKSLILGAAVRTSTTKQTLIPTTARFDIVHANQRLWAHRNSAVKFHKSLMASIRVATARASRGARQTAARGTRSRGK
jgi:hypothetical protein